MSNQKKIERREERRGAERRGEERRREERRGEEMGFSFFLIFYETTKIE